MRRICVVTTSRADYGIYRPVLREIKERPSLDLCLVVSGSHLSPNFGLTVRDIQRDGYDTSERVEMLLSSDTPEGAAKSMGVAMIGFADVYRRTCPDLLLVLGDRFEMHAAATASLPFNIPLAHVHGGELTEGAIDDAVRHSITKMSHLHFTATEQYANRIKQMGEEPWRITVSGAPSLDNLRDFKPLDDAELARLFQLTLEQTFLLVTYHPVTRENDGDLAQMEEMLAALSKFDRPMVFTYPNADPGSRGLIKRLEEYAVSSARARVVVNLGTQGYFTLMQRAAAMVGNSSSGIIEAASFRLPVVNIGSRQSGRLRPANVIDVGASKAEIEAGLKRALDPAFRNSLGSLENPYGDGQAAKRIVDRIQSIDLDQRLLQKHFHEL